MLHVHNLCSFRALQDLLRPYDFYDCGTQVVPLARIVVSDSQGRHLVACCVVGGVDKYISMGVCHEDGVAALNSSLDG